MGLFFLRWYQPPYSIFCWGSKTRFHRKFYGRIPLKMWMKVMLDNRLLSSCKTLLQCAEANSFLIFCGMYNYVCSKGRHSCIVDLVMWSDLFIQNESTLQVFCTDTVFPGIVSAETILFWKWKMWKFSYSFCIMAIFYFINWIVAEETIEGGKLFTEIRYTFIYLRKGVLEPPTPYLLTT